jgi:hypothetical protein
MAQAFIISPVESAAHYPRESEAEREEYEANELKIQSGQSGDQIQCKPGDSEKPGSNSQHRVACFSRHLSSHDHEADDAELESDDQGHNR